MTTTAATPSAAWPGAHVTGTANNVLDRLLDLDLSTSTVTRNGLSNHRAMALIAAFGLGATPDQLVTADARLATNLRPEDIADRAERVTAVTAEVREAGISPTVAARLDPLLDTPATTWFHAMIRLAYAIDAGHIGQIARAIVDWEDRASARAPGRIVADAPLGSVFGDIDPVDERALVTLAERVLLVHLVNDDLFSLHMVTGTHAGQVVAPMLDEAPRRRFTAALVQAMAGNYAAVGSPPLPDAATVATWRAAATEPWDTIAELAAASPDAHLVKLVYTCRAESWLTGGDPLYRYLAMRAVGLTGST